MGFKKNIFLGLKKKFFFIMFLHLVLIYSGLFQKKVILDQNEKVHSV